MIDYRTLSVRVEHLTEHTYEAIVHGPGGDGRVRFDVPEDMPDLESVAVAVSRPRSARRRIETDESALARQFGERLFDLVFQGPARDVMRMSLAEARNEEQGLRMMLELEGAPRLRNVPWELLWDRPKFVSTSAYTPIVRYVDLPQRPRPLEVKPPLRVLGMVSSPGDVRALDTQGERTLLTQACGELDARNLLEIDWVEEATLRGLLERLDSGSYHIFHFIGHGDFDETAEDGVLLFEGPAGRSHRVTGTELGTILSDHRTLRLAVINACEGARVADDWGGIAGSLMQYGLPAVIAMQFEISDDAALSFARSFYASVSRNHPVDEALADARRGMFADGFGLEWATPVMFTSVADCRLFDVRWDQAPAAPARLVLSLEPDQAGPDGVSWRLELRNEGALALDELQPLAGDGAPLAEPFSLGAGERRTVTFRVHADGGAEVVVTVTGVDSEGRIVNERASAKAREVAPPREPPAPPPSPPSLTPRSPATKRAPRAQPQRRTPAPTRRRRRGPLLIAALVVAAVAAIAIASLGGGGGPAGTIAKRVPMPADAAVLAANPTTAVVAGTETLTEVDQHDAPSDDTITGLGHVESRGRSVAVSDQFIWVDGNATNVVKIPRAGGAPDPLTVPRSRYHRLAASRDALWVFSPDASTISRFPIDGSRAPTPRQLRIGAGSQLAVTANHGYLLWDQNHDALHQSIYTLNPDLTDGDPPTDGLTAKAIRTGDQNLVMAKDNTIKIYATDPPGTRHAILVGRDVKGFDYNAGRLWVTYRDGTLRRFSTDGESAGSALELGGDPLAIDARDDRAWVLIARADGKKQLLDVRP